jgi:hypothetical protein
LHSPSHEERRRSARALRRFHDARGVVQENLVFAGEDEQGREPREVGEDG